MNKDISPPAVTGVGVAVVPRQDTDEALWDIYLINLRDTPLENILITSQGYGSVDGVDKTTTILRHFHQTLPSREAIMIEPIQSSLFAISNEYWVSFNDGEHMLDKRYVFAPGTISEDTLVDLPVLDRPGVIQQ
ncbi:hypothetical protein LEM8419_02924 [Neolewinella maritima]|uniref:Uncharacterized protein n=1 Tax=Neolewinella maritima TaxID=1383882 RepID=A0ABN8FCK6_9BACT|nr:hypothetical protein [Neolewinella maritima]CAH1002009.1 hypothetical protein LEM8419_02924 [Neolewinella maritima]